MQLDADGVTDADDIGLPFSLREKRKLRAARGSGITARTATMCSKFIHICILVLPHHDQKYSIFNIIYCIVSFRTSCFC